MARYRASIAPSPLDPDLRTADGHFGSACRDVASELTLPVLVNLVVTPFFLLHQMFLASFFSPRLDAFR